jgi:hypothetical protein
VDQDDLRILIKAWAETLAGFAKAGSGAAGKDIRRVAERIRILTEQLKD